MREMWIILIAYLIGSVPTAYFASRVLGGADPRVVGSGSMGGTNVLRNVGVAPGVLTGVVDVAKGYLAVRLAVAATPSVSGLIPALAGVAAVAGHDWMLFMRFRGGKGIATSLGAYLALLPWAIPILLALIGISSLVLRDVYAGTVTGYWVLVPMLWRAGRLPVPSPGAVAAGDAAAGTLLCVGIALLVTIKFIPDVAARKRVCRRDTGRCRR